MENKITAMILYIVFINIISFSAFLIDKKKAEKKKYRISEATLIVLSFIGGAMGSIIGMVVSKHKLSKPKFYIGVPILLLFNKSLEFFLVLSVIRGKL